MLNWVEIAEDIGSSLYRYFRIQLSPHDASDAVQESLERLYIKVKENAFDAQRGSLRQFAFGIGRNVKSEMLRQPQFDEINEDYINLDKPKNSDRAEALRWAIGRLQNPQREILSLYIDSELTLSEIAAICNIPLNTVKSHMHRAKEQLKEWVQDYE